MVWRSAMGEMAMGGGSEMLKVGLKEIKRRERRGIKKKKFIFSI